MNRFVSLIILPLVAACATGLAVGGSPTGEWRLVSLDGAAPLADGARLALEPNRVGASAGCNTMSAGLRRIGDERIEVAGPLVSTEMFCEPLMSQEQALGELIASSPRWRVDGDRLRLEGGGHSAEFARGG